MTAPPPPDADARLATLEATVAALRQEVAALRAAQLGAASPVTSIIPAPARAESIPVDPAASEPRRAEPARRATSGRGATGLGAAARGWVARLGPEFPADRAGLETLVGRYAAVGVGALVLLMGVGAFLTWAVENFTLAPAARVALGALGAAALAALGERLRRRAGAERFGEMLLALALAVVHVDAWAAGPYLHLVSAGTALGVAAAASAALTALAWRARQQSLFVVGVGGALLAPFVSGAGEAHPFARPIYGWLVITAGLAALVRGSDADRPWRGAGRLLALGVSAYTVAQYGHVVVEYGPPGAAAFLPRLLSAELPGAFALACAAGPLAVAWGRVRRGATPATDATGVLLTRLALAELTTAVLALCASAINDSPEPSLVGYPLAATAGALAITALPGVGFPGAGFPGAGLPSAARRGRLRAPWGAPSLTVAALALPLAALGAALVAVGRFGTPTAAGIAVLWSALSAAAAAAVWRRGPTAADTRDGWPDARLGPHLAAAEFASAFVLVLWSNTHDVLRLALLGAHAAVTAAVFARAPRRTAERDARPLLALAPPLVVLGGATVWAAVLLEARAAFGYTPFLTAPSAGAAVVVAGWAACAAVVWRAGNDLLPRTERAGVVAVAAGVALLWGRAELARAVAPDVATFLLVGYFATVGVGVLALGRARRIAAARQAGLGLALYAALKALVEVSQLDAVLLVGGFLLGVGYWYRAGTQAAGGAAAVQEAV